jgi:hypothetical protein
MSRIRCERPDGAEMITSYRAFDEVVQGFAGGNLRSLLIVGDPGLGKTEALRETLPEAFEVTGRASAYGLYRALYEGRDAEILLDDVDAVVVDPAKLALLKCLLETRPAKTVGWQTSAPARDGLPCSFTTRSRVVLLANRWRTADADVAAVQDRVHVYEFAPTNLEVHLRAATFFWDQEVFDFIGERLGLFPRLTLRHYLLAFEKKRAGLGIGVSWRDFLLRMGIARENVRIAARIKADPSFPDEKARFEAFRAETGCTSRQSYYNALEQVPPAEEAPSITLTSPPPDSSATPKFATVFDLLRERHQRLDGE